jgi:glutamate racemase
VARRYLEPLVERSIDALVLGCTHYPLLVPMLERTLASMTEGRIPIVDSARSVAAEAARFLEDRDLARPRSGSPVVRFHVTDNPEAFVDVGRRFLGGELDAGSVELVDL